MPQTILGIDIGSYSVKVAELRRSFKSFEWVNFFERRIQYNELLSPEESIGAALQGIIDDEGLHWDNAIVGYPEQRVSSRRLTLPFGNLKKIDQTIEFELEGAIPFNLEQVVVDYHVLRAAKDSSEVLVVYAMKEELAKWLEALGRTNIDPRYLAVEGVELFNLVMIGMVPPEGVYAVVDLGHSKTILTLCHGKKFVFSRAISFGGKDITENIQKKLNVSAEEAEKLKIELAQIPTEGGEKIDPLSEQVVAAVRESVDKLLVSLRQVLFAFQDLEGEGVSGVYLTGGTSRLPGLDRYLSEALRQNVTHIDCTDFHFNHLKTQRSHRAVMSQALGLALRGVALPGMPVLNLRSGDFAFKGDVEELGGSIRHVAVALILMIVMGLGYFGLKYYLLTSRAKKMNTEVAELIKSTLGNIPPQLVENPTQAANYLKSKQNEALDRLNKLNAELNVTSLRVLQEISQKMPSREEVQLDVEDLNVLKDRVRLSGRVNSFVAVDKIKAAMESSDLFNNVTTGDVHKGVKDEVKFNLSMELKWD